MNTLPCLALAVTSSGTVKEIAPSCRAVSISKAVSQARLAPVRLPARPARKAILQGTVMRKGVGPPGGWLMAYKYQPGSMEARAVTSSRSPKLTGSAPGEATSFQDTGAGAAPSAVIAIRQRNAISRARMVGLLESENAVPARDMARIRRDPTSSRARALRPLSRTQGSSPDTMHRPE